MNAYAKFNADAGQRWRGLVLVGALHLGVGALLLGERLAVSLTPKPMQMAVIPQERPKPVEPDLLEPKPVELKAQPLVMPLSTEEIRIRTEVRPKTDGPEGVVVNREAAIGPVVLPAEGQLMKGSERQPTQPASIGLACPQQVAPEMPARAAQKGVSGSVRALLTVRAGRVVQVEVLNAQPRGYFEAAVRSAVQQYACVDTGAQAVVAEQLFEFSPGD